MVRIRLRRIGKKKQPSYRVVAIEMRNSRDGRFIETLGHYNPRTEPATMKLDEEKLLTWLGKGASPSETVQRLLTKSGVWQKYQDSKKKETISEVKA